MPIVTWKCVTLDGHAEMTSFEPIHQARRALARSAL
jgi:hypothetical protein